MPRSRIRDPGVDVLVCDRLIEGLTCQRLRHIGQCSRRGPTGQRKRAQQCVRPLPHGETKEPAVWRRPAQEVRAGPRGAGMEGWRRMTSVATAMLDSYPVAPRTGDGTRMATKQIARTATALAQRRHQCDRGAGGMSIRYTAMAMTGLNDPTKILKCADSNLSIGTPSLTRTPQSLPAPRCCASTSTQATATTRRAQNPATTTTKSHSSTDRRHSTLGALLSTKDQAVPSLAPPLPEGISRSCGRG